MTETAEQRPAHYPQSIRAAHWIVVALVTLQFLTGGGMDSAFPESLSVTVPAPFAAVLHVLSGLSILAVMLWRLTVRLRAKVPPPPADEPRWLQYISRGTHYAFYILLIGMPLAGLTAVATGSETVGELHKATSWLLLALVLAHIAGAFWHITMGDGVMHRISGISRHRHDRHAR